MKRMPRTWKLSAVGVLVRTSLAGCVVGGYGGGVGVGYVGGVYEPGAMSTAAGALVIVWGLRAAVSTSTAAVTTGTAAVTTGPAADGRRPRFRMTRATAAAVAIVAAGTGTDRASQQARRESLDR
jgi:hypothetical protein